MVGRTNAMVVVVLMIAAFVAAAMDDHTTLPVYASEVTRDCLVGSISGPAACCSAISALFKENLECGVYGAGAGDLCSTLGGAAARDMNLIRSLGSSPLLSSSSLSAGLHVEALTPIFNHSYFTAQ